MKNAQTLKGILNAQSRSLLSKIFLAFFIGLAVWLGLFFLAPSVRPHLHEEDKLFEHVTNVLLGLSFLTGMILVFQRKHKTERLTALGIALFAGVALGDELSWGERYFSIEMPTFAGKKIDGIHDLVEVVWDIEIAGSNDLWRIVMAVVLLGLAWYFRKSILRFLQKVMTSPCGTALVAVGIMGAFALLFDIHIVEFAARHALEEYCELAAASTLLVSLFLLARYGLPNASP